jgi:hypothetical protein
MVPNGILANNAAINAKTSAFLSYVLSHQDSTGWLGPEVGTNKPRYLWGRFVFLSPVFRRKYSPLLMYPRYPFMFGAIQMTEFNPALTDQVVTALYKFANLANTMLKSNNTGEFILSRPGTVPADTKQGWKRGRKRAGSFRLRPMFNPNSQFNREDFVMTLQWYHSITICGGFHCGY